MGAICSLYIVMPLLDHAALIICRPDRDVLLGYHPYNELNISVYVLYETMYKRLERFRSVCRGIVRFKTLGQHKSKSEGLFWIEAE